MSMVFSIGKASMRLASESTLASSLLLWKCSIRRGRGMCSTKIIGTGNYLLLLN